MTGVKDFNILASDSAFMIISGLIPLISPIVIPIFIVITSYLFKIIYFWLTAKGNKKSSVGQYYFRKLEFLDHNNDKYIKISDHLIIELTFIILIKSYFCSLILPIL